MLIFTTNRAIRNYTKQFLDRNTKLPHLISISEFQKRAIYIPEYRYINPLEREIIFNQVVKRVRNSKVFKIDTEILNFISYSKYFFSFFNELAQEKISIDEVAKADYYEDFREHISILRDIYHQYQTELDKLGYIDPIYIPKKYRLNIPYLKSIGDIEFRFEGRLSNFQIELFENISQYVPVRFRFIRTKYNRDLDSQIGIELQPNYIYLIDLGSKKILESRQISITPHIDIYPFRYRISQIPFIQERIYHFHEKIGIPLEKIGVVLLDEKFSKYVKVFDRLEGKGNLNFSMGDSIDSELFFQFLSAILTYLENREAIEHSNRIKRVIGESEELKKIYETFSNSWFQGSIEEFQNLVIETLKLIPPPNKTIRELMEILKLFNSPLFAKSNFRTLLSLFLREVGKVTIDDIQGGKVTTQGLLETRGADYQAVIVIDFNDDIFPKREEKDIFLNSEIRKAVGLPTLEDREALQKLYLQQLFQKAQYVAISYVETDRNRISRFFYDFSFKKRDKIEKYEEALLDIAFPNRKEVTPWSDEVVDRYNFQKYPLSNHKLQTFLECPRKFYFSYILNIQPHRPELDISLSIGNLLHRILHGVYSEKRSFQSEEELFRAILDRLEKDTTIPKVYISYWQEKIKKFVQTEIERFRQGITIYKLEENITIDNYRGFKLVGKIDRIDKLPNGDLVVIDYKSSEPNRKDYQLLFYYLLLRERGESISTENLYYYNLQTGKLIPNSVELLDLEKELSNLENLSQQEINFSKIQRCPEHCPYFDMCSINIDN